MPKPGKKKGQRAEPPKEEPPAPKPEELEVEPVEEEEGLGLGTSSKRKQRKEKKQKQEAARQEASTSFVQPVISSKVPEPVVEEPKPTETQAEEKKVEKLEEELDGLGLGGGGGKRKRPKKKKTDAPAEVQPEQAAPQQSAATAEPQPSSAAQPVADRPHVLQQMATSASFPPGFASATAPAKGATPGPWGSGRGQGQGPTRPTFPASQSTTQVGQQRPPQPRVEPPQQRPQARPTGLMSQENVMCRYKVPTKIPGNNLRGVRMIKLITNYLEMDFKPLNIHRYDVSFSPDRPKKMIPEVFKIVKEKIYPQELLAFDQTKNCYSLRQLKNVPPNERFSTSVEIADRNGKIMRFEVSLKATGVVELAKIKRYMNEKGASAFHPTEEVQCIDVILRQGTLESYVKAGRQFFKRPYNPIDLGHGYEMWTGLFQSAIFTSKAFINIDVAHKGFPRHQPMINALVKDFNLDPNKRLENQRPMDVESFSGFLKGLKVVATLVGANCPTAGQKREYVCNQFVDPPGQLKFELTEGQTSRVVSVGEYFAKEKKYQIKYPNLNCIWVGSRDKTIYFPMELLEVAYGQPLARQLDETQVSKMVREAATPPDQRMRKIKEVISSMKYTTNPEFKKFGLEISDKFYEVNAKVLEPPVLDVGHRDTAVPRKGVWSANTLLKPESLTAWGFVAVETSPNNEYESVIQLLINTGKNLGMNISNPMLKRYDVQLNNLRSVLGHAVANGIKFVFVVVSARGRDHYHRVKQFAEREVGVLTQCVKEATARRMNAMTAKNILLKVNSKLMGINQALGERTMPKCLQGGGVMIVGADVTHPSPDQSNIPSIAAVTASIDPKCYMYNIALSIQTPKKEMIVEFEGMIFDHLKVYFERNRQLPRKIFVFRDGVSEGQFIQVMNSELAAVHAAYSRLSPNKKPEILFLLVQKRHHTRFFNRDDRSAQYNVEPGTVVDTDIVHASELDFYLVSHQAIKGTARPTRYHAVCNDGRIPDDEVEQLTYYLCHLYSRCMRSVSYPTPTYYAHLACLRARSLTHGEKFDNKALEHQPKRLTVLDRMLEYSRMFFV